MVDKKWGQLYNNLFDSRQECELDKLSSFDKDRANSLYLKADQFINSIAEYEKNKELGSFFFEKIEREGISL